MAGKKEKKAKKDGKKTSFLPKVIDGIKLPKDARRQLTNLAKHPVIADLLASGLVALAQRIKGNGAKAEAAQAATPTPEATPAATVTETAAHAAKPAVKRIRKPAATSAAPADDASAAKPAPVRRTRKPATAKPAAATAEPGAAPATTEAKPAKVAKAPPPRRTRKKADTTAKPRTRRTPPKTES